MSNPKPQQPQPEEDNATAETISEDVQQILQDFFEDDSVQGFFEHQDSVFVLCVSPASDTLVLSGDGNDTAFLWDCSTGQQLATLAGHTDSVVCGGFSADGKLVATGGMDGTVRVYDVETALGGDTTPLHVLEGPAAELEFLAWHPKGHVIIAGGADTTCWMWNAKNGACMQVFAGHVAAVMAGDFTPDGKRVFTSSEDGSLFVWNPKTGESEIHVKGGSFHDGPVTCARAHPDPAQPLLVTGSQDASACVVHRESGKVLNKFTHHQDSVETAAFCKTLPFVATGSVDGTVCVWDTRTGALRTTLRHDDSVTALLWHPIEPHIFTTSVDLSVRLWDARSGDLIRRWVGHKDAILCLALSGDGGLVITGSDDQQCLVFSCAKDAPNSTMEQGSVIGHVVEDGDDDDAAGDGTANVDNGDGHDNHNHNDDDDDDDDDDDEQL